MHSRHGTFVNFKANMKTKRNQISLVFELKALTRFSHCICSHCCCLLSSVCMSKIKVYTLWMANFRWKVLHAQRCLTNPKSLHYDFFFFYCPTADAAPRRKNWMETIIVDPNFHNNYIKNWRNLCGEYGKVTVTVWFWINIRRDDNQHRPIHTAAVVSSEEWVWKWNVKRIASATMKKNRKINYSTTHNGQIGKLMNEPVRIWMGLMVSSKRASEQEKDEKNSH